MADEETNRFVGSAWEKTGKNGKYLSVSLDVDKAKACVKDGKLTFFLFKAKTKKTPKHPDFHAVKPGQAGGNSLL